jgi:hypothetical protein
MLIVVTWKSEEIKTNAKIRRSKVIMILKQEKQAPLIFRWNNTKRLSFVFVVFIFCLRLSKTFYRNDYSTFSVFMCQSIFLVLFLFNRKN